MESIVKSLPAKKTLDPDGFTGEFLQTFKGEMIRNLYKLFQTTEEDANFPTHSMRPALHTKPNKDVIRK